MAKATAKTETVTEMQAVKVEKQTGVTLELTMEEAAYLSGLTMWWPTNLFVRESPTSVGDQIKGFGARTPHFDGIRSALDSAPGVRKAAEAMWGPSGHPA